jgi:hypothetical protein
MPSYITMIKPNETESGVSAIIPAPNTQPAGAHPRGAILAKIVAKRGVFRVASTRGPKPGAEVAASDRL